MDIQVSPFLFFPVVLVLLVLTGCAGTAIRRRFRSVVADDHADQFTALQASVLALLGLLLGFSFSMAIERFEGRQQAEINEANAISASFVRTSTLEPEVARTQRSLIQQYVAARIAFFDARRNIRNIDVAENQTSELGDGIWKDAMRVGGPASSTPRDSTVDSYLTSLTAMFEAREFRRVAYENRIPNSAWLLLIAVACVANFLVGLGAWRWHTVLLLILPVVVASTLTLIYDLDIPRRGLIHVSQQSMMRLQAQVNARADPRTDR